MQINYILFTDRKKRFSSVLLASLFCWAGPFLVAQNLPQSVVSAGGGRMSSGRTTLDWTLGEPIAGDFSTSSKWLTAGFHQPVLIVEAVEAAAFEAVDRSATTAEKVAFLTQVWPNPTAGTVAARVDSKEWASASFLLTAADGLAIEKADRPTNADFEIELGERPNGIYFLHFFSPDGQPLGSRKITLIK